MLADNLDRIVARMTKELLRALRDASRKELAALLPALKQEMSRAASSASASSSARGPARGRKAAAPAKKPGAKGKAKASKEAAGGRSLTRQILKLLKVRREGFRSEEIQRRLGADADELKETLARLMTDGRIVRHGQARGTRYSLPSGDEVPESTASVEVADEPHGSPETPHEPPPEAEPIEVTPAMIDQVRMHLIESASPVTLPELEGKLSYPRAQLKAVLDHMHTHGLVQRERSGPAVRFRLAAHAPAEGRREGAVRVRRRDKEHAEGEASSADAEATEAPEAPEVLPES